MSTHLNLLPCPPCCPPGAVLFVEVKHWKSDKKRFSTLAWSYCPLDRLVDFGAQAARVRRVEGVWQPLLPLPPLLLLLQRWRIVQGRVVSRSLPPCQQPSASLLGSAPLPRLHFPCANAFMRLHPP